MCCAVCDTETVLDVMGHYLTFFLSASNEVFVSGVARPNINSTAKPLAVGISNIHFDWNLLTTLMNKMLCSLATTDLAVC